MCDYVSFLVTKEGRFYFGDLESHSGIEEAYGLKPDSYREAEWVGNDSKSLTVRVSKGEEENWYKALVLGIYKTRDALLQGVTKGKAYDEEYTFKNGKLHNTDGPAITDSKGSKEYYQNGLRHRTKGPAIVTKNGYKAYYKEGKKYRNKGPALIWPDGHKEYWQNNELHRENGPAIIYCDGDTEYWKRGKGRKL